jgi:GTPase
MSIPTISILGRPNVGKSSLFNRIIGERTSVTQHEAGTTRDKVERLITIEGRRVRLVDTGGYLVREQDRITSFIRKQVKDALKISDIIVFVCDCMAGVTPQDQEMVALLRGSAGKIILVANKADNKELIEGVSEFYQLGMGEPHAVSCSHKIGIEHIKQVISGRLKDVEHAEKLPESFPIKVAIVGRPNVGKSSLLNKLLNAERVIVDDVPGTTRDAIDTHFKEGGTDFLLIDTAGIRHARKVKKPVEAYSMMRSRDAIGRSDVALILVDGLEGVTKDDMRVVDFVIKNGKGCIICVNKWDLVKGITMERYKKAVLRKMPEAEGFPIIFISAKTGRQVVEVVNQARAVKTSLDLSFDEEALSDMIDQIRPDGVPVPRGGRIPRFFGMKMLEHTPKAFIVFVSNPRDVRPAHSRYITNNLRALFPLNGVPIKLIFKRRKKNADSD